MPYQYGNPFGGFISEFPPDTDVDISTHLISLEDDPYLTFLYTLPPEWFSEVVRYIGGYSGVWGDGWGSGQEGVPPWKDPSRPWHFSKVQPKTVIHHAPCPLLDYIWQLDVQHHGRLDDSQVYRSCGMRTVWVSWFMPTASCQKCFKCSNLALLTHHHRSWTDNPICGLYCYELTVEFTDYA